MNLKETSTFNISLIGDRTGEKWFGEFKSLRRLTHRSELMRDRIAREFLGPNPDGASQRAKDQSDMFAELSVSIVESPEWWKSAGNGLDLGDDNVVMEVWQNVMRIKVEAIQEIQKKGDDAAKKLESLAEGNVAK